jgi:hypothetical protein
LATLCSVVVRSQHGLAFVFLDGPTSVMAPDSLYGLHDPRYFVFTWRFSARRQGNHDARNPSRSPLLQRLAQNRRPSERKSYKLTSAFLAATTAGALTPDAREGAHAPPEASPNAWRFRGAEPRQPEGRAGRPPARERAWRGQGARSHCEHALSSLPCERGGHPLHPCGISRRCTSDHGAPCRSSVAARHYRSISRVALPRSDRGAPLRAQARNRRKRR